MIDFQKIRNKQKWLFGIIAIPVIIGFVVMFTPDATDTLLGTNNQRTQQADFGEINNKPVTGEQWLSARQLSGMLYGRYGNEYMERKIVDTLVEMEMLEEYSIKPTTTDALDRLIKNKKKYDLILIDADKENYISYFDKSIKLLNSNGLLIVDNILWKGEVTNNNAKDKLTVKMKKFNSYVKKTKINKYILPIGDGFYICWK